MNEAARSRPVDILFDRLEPLYRDHPAWAGERERIGALIGRERAARPAPLVASDGARAADPAWFGRPDMIGYSFYVDRFAGTLRGLAGRLPWLDDLGIRLLHPLPINLPQSGDSDGGFAVADYRAIDPAIGTVEDVRALAADLHGRGMALAMDCVLNHCARDHAWAQAALAGDPVYRDYFRIVADGDVAGWEASLDQVFPDTAPGNFTREAAVGGSVWTTFYPFQWDLNWANPAVFREMLGVLLFWANIGVDAFRLDSAPYLWKRQGTPCRNLPETHALVAALRAGLDAVAPGVALLAEAIEQTDQVMPYLEPADGSRACQIAYQNSAMAATWVSLATGDPAPLATIADRTRLTRDDTAWLTYLRCHDDIIWSALEGTVPTEVLRWCSHFYTGADGGYAGGASFQAREDAAPSTVGMLAALIGGEGPEAEARYRLLLGILLALPGMPVLYMGDEIGLPNAGREYDARWLHRPTMDWPRADAAAAGDGAGAGFLAATRTLVRLRGGLPALDAKATTRILADPGLFLMIRGEGDDAVLVAANFGDAPRPLTRPAGWHGRLADLAGGAGDRDGAGNGDGVGNGAGDGDGVGDMLPAYGMVWLVRA